MPSPQAIIESECAMTMPVRLACLVTPEKDIIALLVGAPVERIDNFGFPHTSAASSENEDGIEEVQS